MPNDARTEALEWLRACANNLYYNEPRFGPHDDRFYEALLDAIPAGVLARLAVERGGLEVIGWAYSPYKRLALQYHLCRDEPAAHLHRQPVYRLTEEATDGR